MGNGAQIEYLIEGRFTLNSLLESGVSQKSISKVEKTLKLPANSRDENLYFVGFFELDNKLFISFPKSLSIDSLTHNHARSLMSLMRKISNNTNVTSHIPDNDLLRTSQNIEHLSRLNLADFIISDFIKNGDITFKSSQNIINNIREPNWTKTLEALIPITSGTSHIYDQWISKKKSSKYDHIIKNIHAFVINECIKKYGSILGVNKNEVKNYNVKPTFPPKNATKLINAKLREVYVQRDILVLKALKKWLENGNSSSSYEFYGTRYFHVIWEEVCSYLLNNSKHEEYWKNAFKNPIWKYYDTKQIKKSDAFEVDIICQSVDEKLILADAKYYDISIRNRGILGVSDLSKQINYETQLSKSTAFIDRYKSNKDLINFFIFPVDDYKTHQKLLCEIEFPKLYDKKLYGVSFDTFSSFDRYCANKPLSSLEISSFIGQIK